jgi:hypothetical protein
VNVARFTHVIKLSPGGAATNCQKLQAIGFGAEMSCPALANESLEEY